VGLPNVGYGPDPLSMQDIVERADFAVLLLLRDYHYPKCNQQVRSIAEYAEDLSDRNVAVVAILPDSRAKAEKWQAEYDLPFPLLADPDREVGEAYDQPTRFGALGSLHDFLGRLPQSMVIDTRDEQEIVWTHEGESPGDRPETEGIVV
jgi:peroxiredoxin Q/BCP